MILCLDIGFYVWRVVLTHLMNIWLLGLVLHLWSLLGLLTAETNVGKAYVNWVLYSLDFIRVLVREEFLAFRKLSGIVTLRLIVDDVEVLLLAILALLLHH